MPEHTQARRSMTMFNIPASLDLLRLAPTNKSPSTMITIQPLRRFITALSGLLAVSLSKPLLANSIELAGGSDCSVVTSMGYSF